MKKLFSLTILVFLSIYSMAQNNYKEQWKAIEAKEIKGLLKSTLPEVNKIYNQAKSEKNESQIIRALLYQSKIAIITSDTDSIQYNVVQNFYNELPTASPKAKALLKSILGEILNNYYEYHSWEINNRTELAEETSNDFRFWTSNIFNQKITELYLQSIENKSTLQKDSINNWDDILTVQKKYRELRPTLYDFLAHRALKYFNNMSYNYYSRDNNTEDLKKHTLNILEDLIEFHKNSENKNPYLYNKLLLTNKKNEDGLENDKLAYQNQLINLSKEFPSTWYTANILLQLADSYVANAQEKIDYDNALSIVEKINLNYPQTEANQQANELKENILSQNFNIQIETYIPNNQYNPINISHKNLEQLYFKILQYNNNNVLENPFQELQYANEKSKQEELNKLLKKYPLQQNFSIKLKSFNDYQDHSTLAKLDALPTGSYLVLVSNNADFKVNEKYFLLQTEIINVTNYAIIENRSEILVTDRNSGLPAKEKTIEFFTRAKNNINKIISKTTNNNGKTELPTLKRGQLYYQIKDENVFYNQYIYNYSNSSNKKDFVSSKIFTDRSIYRPGQTIYFKGIIYNTNKEDDTNVLKNTSSYVYLKNQNSDEVSKIKVKTNEFGSYTGQFILPNGGLTGSYYLEDDYSTHSISVEEYKRPKFEVEFNKITNTFKLDQEVTTKGKAIAFSGANINNAKVVYRVFRQAIYPYIPYWKRVNYNYETEEEITHGETTTKEDGSFQINFIAKTNKPKTKEPRTYTYKVIADITDVNGETQSNEQSITVGDRQLILDFPLKEEIEWSNFKEISIKTENLNGEFVPAKGEITLTKIKVPKQVVRNLSLNTGSYKLYGQEEFLQYFPHLIYSDEKNLNKMTEGSPSLQTTFDTKKNKSVAVELNKNWKEGAYLLKGWIFDEQDTIQIEKIIEIYNINKTKPTDYELFSVNLDKESYQPNDVANVIFSSAANNSTVFITLEHDGKIIDEKQISLNNSVNHYKIPIKEEYRGNLFLHYYFGKYNGATSETINISVPYESTELNITANTLRDKLKPNQEETWELTITGPKKDKVTAELLATMYDASLDQFKPHSIQFYNRKPTNYAKLGRWDLNRGFSTKNFNTIIDKNYQYFYSNNNLPFDQLNWFGFNLNNSYNQYEFRDELKTSAVAYAADAPAPPSPEQALQGRVEGINIDSKDKVAIRGVSKIGESEYRKDSILIEKKGDKLKTVQARKSLQETAFFYPNLYTDENGNVKIKFTVPESLTEWKFIAMAHTPDLKTGNFQANVRTQKDLMVVPNPPRFLREGDQITFSSKIVNLSDKELKGTAQLQLFNAFTMQPIDAEFGNTNNLKDFTVNFGNSQNLNWELTIPNTHQAIVYRIVASAGDFSDGEESALPILSNRTMVTETMPIHVREGQNKTFTLNKLKNNKSNTLSNFKLTLEMTTNPIWYAIFSLPYLREYPYECSEQVFSRFYGNVISQHLIQSSPKIKAVFDDWNSKGELKSKLENNEELKSLLLEETPWVREAENEEEQMKRIALLFDLNTMQNELRSALNKLKNKQSSSGGFPWFEGGRESRTITTHIVSGFGHLKNMEILVDEKLAINSNDILKQAIDFIDKKMEDDYNKYLKNKKLKPSLQEGIAYLYARSYFLKEYPLSKKGVALKDYFLAEMEKEKLNQHMQIQAKMSLVFHRFNKENSAKTILNSLKDHAVQSDEMGMYWKSNTSGWYWHQAPIETQSLLIEAFNEILNDIESVESMKVWLLKNRQTNQWNSTKATTEAVYALMNTGKDWTNAEDGITLTIGGELLDLKSLGSNPQSGSGYVKTSWNKDEIKQEMATVQVNKTSPGVAWGAVYWQYFEDLDKITEAKTGIRFKKELFLKKNTSNGPTLIKITEKTPIQIGDLVSVRLEIQNDRDMEFVHIKDMRASGFEPTNVFSSYKWKNNLGYYESTRDAATNFFIDSMPKGIYVFEYDLRANNAGNFSNGITVLQNMYAPELSAQSKGIRVFIKN